MSDRSRGAWTVLCMTLSDRNQRLVRRLLSLALLAMFLTPVLVGGLAAPARADNPAGDTGSSLELPAPPDLNALDQARKTIAEMTATPPKTTGKVTLVSSWPDQGARLWVPGREARLTFDQPVRPVDVTMQIAERGSGSALVVNRNFTDITLRTIRFSVDGMQPGEYVVTWSAGETSGTYRFRMDDVPRAGGGGNHRSHDFAVLTPGLSERYALMALVLLLALAFVRTLTAGHARTVRAVAVSGAAAAGFSSWRSLDLESSTTAIDSLATAGPWSWLVFTAVLATAGFARSLRVVRLAALGGLVVFATAPHDSSLSTSLVYNSVLVSIVMLGALVINQHHPDGMWRSGRRDRVVTAAVLAVISLAFVFVANGFEAPEGSFVDALVLRVMAVVGLMAAVVTGSRRDQLTTAGSTEENHLASVAMDRSSSDEQDATVMPIGDDVTTTEPPTSMLRNARGLLSAGTRLLPGPWKGHRLVALAHVVGFAAVVILTQLPPGRAGI